MENNSYDIEKLIKETKIEMHKSYNDIYLTSYEYDVLKRNGFNIEKYSNLRDLIFDIESQLNDGECDVDLEKVAADLSEFNYYHNTYK